MRERPSHDSNHYPRHDKKSLVERYIHEAVQSKNKFGPGNFLYVCLAALLELHLSTAPTSVFHIADFGYYQGLMRKYRRNFEDMANDFPPVNNYPGMATNEPLPVDTYPDMGWRQLRVELDDQRYTLRWMTRFFKRHLDYRNKDLQAAFKELRGRFKLRVQDLEQVESQLRDQMASEGIDKSIRMAEMSIRESKRVMLLTALAFIFLPISLASSVYGMNVQQINGTGHSIGAFLVTAFAMFASAVVLWACIAGVQSRRVRLKKDLKSDSTTVILWHWYDWLITLSFFATWESLWNTLDRKWSNYKTRRY
jgi:hypothetical protein